MLLTRKSLAWTGVAVMALTVAAGAIVDEPPGPLLLGIRVEFFAAAPAISLIRRGQIPFTMPTRTDQITLRHAAPADLPAIIELTCSAFGEQVRERMIGGLYRDTSHRLEQSLIAEVDGGQGVGCVQQLAAPPA